MQKKKKTSVLNLHLNLNRRLVFVSDIHGDLKLLKEGLAKIKFNKEDILFVIGDIIEKGEENLAILDYLLELQRQYEVYLLAGNCDEVLRFIIPPVDKQAFLHYSLGKNQTIIQEMARRLGVTIDNNVDVDALCELFYRSFNKYYDFVDQFYDVIIINERYVVVHGGLDSLADIPDYSLELLKYDSFYSKAEPTQQLRIVGHFPVTNYKTFLPSNNPIFDFSKNVIAIDGGNNVSLGGQLNFLEIKNDTYSFVFVDNYPSLRAKTAIKSKGMLGKVNSYVDEVIYKGEKLGDYYLVYDRERRLYYSHCDDMTINDTGYFCHNAINNFFSLNVGETYSLVRMAQPYALIKKNGILGLIDYQVVVNDAIQSK